jgi:rhodanese-related sulfurtransferase
MQQLLEFALNHWQLSLAFVAILGLLLAQPLIDRMRGLKEVDPSEAVGLMNHSDALFVDVREQSELADGQVTESLHIPLTGFEKNLGLLEKHKDRPIIVGCRSGHRSGRACSILRKNGYTHVYNLRGGLMAWQNAGLPLLKGGKPKKKR